MYKFKLLEYSNISAHVHLKIQVTYDHKLDVIFDYEVDLTLEDGYVWKDWYAYAPKILINKNEVIDQGDLANYNLNNFSKQGKYSIEFKMLLEELKDYVYDLFKKMKVKIILGEE